MSSQHQGIYLRIIPLPAMARHRAAPLTDSPTYQDSRCWGRPAYVVRLARANVRVTLFPFDLMIMRHPLRRQIPRTLLAQIDRMAMVRRGEEVHRTGAHQLITSVKTMGVYLTDQSGDRKPRLQKDILR